MTSFSAFKLLPTLQAKLDETGLTTPTEIQARAIPLLRTPRLHTLALICGCCGLALRGAFSKEITLDVKGCFLWIAISCRSVTPCPRRLNEWRTGSRLFLANDLRALFLSAQAYRSLTPECLEVLF